MAVGCSAGAGSGIASIIEEAEPGPRLTVEGIVRDADTGEPVADAKVVVYQTDQTGSYQPDDPTDESTARIRGVFITDAEGRFGFVTVQPGEYPDQPLGNRHIHFPAVTADGYEETGFVLLFEDNVRDEVRSWAESTGFGVVIELSGDPVSGYHGSLEIDLEPA